MNVINSFRGKYFFLSNYLEAKVQYEGITYNNNEAAFQSAKLADKEKRVSFSELPACKAKSKGKTVQLRHNWDKIKIDIMYQICLNKFSQNPELKRKLLETGDAYLEEGNDWGDKIWGTVNGVGQNNLGKILMRVREVLRKMDKERVS